MAAIGLAGENRVYIASIEQGRSSASRQGIGAVMGRQRAKGDSSFVEQRMLMLPSRLSIWRSATKC